MSHCGRDPSVTGACGGTNESCSCECTTCACPNCSKRYEDCVCVKHYYCRNCKLTPEEAAGGACDSMGSSEHNWDWSF